MKDSEERFTKQDGRKGRNTPANCGLDIGPTEKNDEGDQELQFQNLSGNKKRKKRTKKGKGR